MDYKAYQDNFDKQKWCDSVFLKEDRCGTYPICDYCDKEEEFPCAHAAERFEKSRKIRIAILHCYKR